MTPDRRTILAAGLLATLPRKLEAATGVPAGPRPFASPKTGIRIDPRTLGARADGTTDDTAALQAALDRCAVLGGGEVVLAGGTFLTGTIRIGSDTTLRIEPDATLQGSPDIERYPIGQVRWEGSWVAGRKSLVTVEDARRVTIAGTGRIAASPTVRGRIAPDGLRNPALMEFTSVEGLAVTGLRLQGNEMWAVHPVYCEDATFAGLDLVGGADGIDVDSCRRIRIEHCTFDTGDDCVSLKSGRGMEGAAIARPTEDVTIADCTMRDRHWACIGIGSETSGGIRRVRVERCRFLAARTFSLYLKSRPGRGAFIEDIAITDCEASGAGQGFLRLNFLDSGKQDQFPVPGREGIPHVANISVERIRVTAAPVLVEAVNIHPDRPLDGFTLAGITGTATRGITLANMRRVRLSGIACTIAEGPRLATANVTGTGLAGAVALIPPPAPAPVTATEPPFRLGMGVERPN